MTSWFRRSPLSVWALLPDPFFCPAATCRLLLEYGCHLKPEAEVLIRRRHCDKMPLDRSYGLFNPPQ
jgi:hypothetical protein